MTRLVLFLITLGALAALVMVFLAYGLTAAVATGVVLTLAGGATTIVLRLAGTTAPPAQQLESARSGAGAGAHAATPAVERADDRPDE
jgi:hypothetical protein